MGRGWGALFVLMHRRQNRFGHAVDVHQHIIVPEAQDAIAPCSKISGSLFIFGNVVGITMSRSVDLDNETPFMTGEVSEERSDSGLPPEMRMFDWQPSQMPPEFAFRIGHVATQFACTRDSGVYF